MLELLDLRDRRERLEPRRLEIDPHVSAIAREIVRPVRYENDDALFDLTMRFDGADLRERGLLVIAEEFRAPVDAIPGELRRALDGLTDRIADLHRCQLPAECEDERGGVRFGGRVRPIRAVARGSATPARSSRDRSRRRLRRLRSRPRTTHLPMGARRGSRAAWARPTW